MIITIVRYGFLNENFRSSLCGECACNKFAEHRRQVNHDDGGDCGDDCGDVGDSGDCGDGDCAFVIGSD